MDHQQKYSSRKGQACPLILVLLEEYQDYKCVSFANYAEFDIFLRELGKRHWQIDRSEPLDGDSRFLAKVRAKANELKTA